MPRPFKGSTSDDSHPNPNQPFNAGLLATYLLFLHTAPAPYHSCHGHEIDLISLHGWQVQGRYLHILLQYRAKRQSTADRRTQSYFFSTLECGITHLRLVSFASWFNRMSGTDNSLNLLLNSLNCILNEDLRAAIVFV